MKRTRIVALRLVAFSGFGVACASFVFEESAKNASESTAFDSVAYKTENCFPQLLNNASQLLAISKYTYKRHTLS